MGKPCKSQGFPLAGHISRILSRVTIHLCSYPVPRRAASTEPVRLAPDGVWLAAVSPRRWWALTPPFHPYRRRLRRTRRRRFAFCATVRRLSPPPSRERPALRCPDFPRSHLTARPRSPGLQIQFYLDACNFGPSVQRHLALGAAQRWPVVEHELPTHRTLERGAAQQREQFLLEGPVQGAHCFHSSRKTPTTLPRTCTYSA